MTIDIVVSDIHLGSPISRRLFFKQFLEEVAFDHLIIAGDLFDHLNFTQYKSGDWVIIRKLRLLADEGKIIYLRGNHEYVGVSDDIRDFLSNCIGARVVDDTYKLSTIAGSYLIVHGDKFDNTIGWKVIGDLADWMYQKISDVSYVTGSHLKYTVKELFGIHKKVMLGAVKLAKSKKCIGVIAGHTHHADTWHLPSGFTYFNSGCWTDNPCNYVKIENGVATLKEFK